MRLLFMIKGLSCRNFKIYKQFDFFSSICKHTQKTRHTPHIKTLI